MMDECVLVCLCVDQNKDPIGEPFHIWIGVNQPVGELKRVVKLEKGSDLDFVATDRLRLWKVNEEVHAPDTPLQLATFRQKICALHFPDGTSNAAYANDHAVQYLSPYSMINEHWKDLSDLPSKRLHIIATAPIRAEDVGRPLKRKRDEDIICLRCQCVDMNHKPIGEVLPIDISPDKDVGHLKYVIKRERHIDMDCLTMWRLFPPIPKITPLEAWHDKIKDIQYGSSTALDTTSGALKIDSMDKISTHWLSSTDAPDEHLHIIATIDNSPFETMKSSKQFKVDSFSWLWERLNQTMYKSRKVPPSRGAQSTEYRSFDGRTVAPPIELYHPAFAQFRAHFRDKSLKPPDETIRLTGQLMRTLSEIITDERERYATTRKILGDILLRGLIQNVNADKTSSDYIGIAVRRSNPAETAGTMLLEENSFWGNTDPSVQGSFSYLQFWGDNDRDNLRNACCCPTFIVGLSGAWITIIGAVLLQGGIFQRLTPYLWFGNSRVLDHDNVVDLARVFTALELGIQTLHDYYLTSDFILKDPSRFFPSIKSYYSNSQEVIEFEYLGFMQPDIACVTYLARRLKDQKKILVKFTDRYGREAHELLASKGMAPKLLHCGQIGNTLYGKLLIVVMEYLDGESLWSRYNGMQVPTEVREGVRRAVEELGKESVVHGDLRRPNIMTVEDFRGEIKVMIVDFDWAGKAGHVKYPLHLSKDVKWPKGVRDMDLIKRCHDLEMIERL